MNEEKIHLFLLEKIKCPNFQWRLTDSSLLIWSSEHKAAFTDYFKQDGHFLKDLQEICSFPIMERGNNYIYFSCFKPQELTSNEIQKVIHAT